MGIVSDFARDESGKISDKILSDYGRNYLKNLQGAQFIIDRHVIRVEGDKLVYQETKSSPVRIFDIIDSDLKINKILYRIV